jgi:hypothetical protein
MFLAPAVLWAIGQASGIAQPFLPGHEPGRQPSAPKPLPPAQVAPAVPTPPPAAVPAQAAPAGAVPKIQFAELTHDFGRITSTEPVRHEFIFTNVGQATLQINEVRPSCGCTTAGTWDRTVEPGKTGKIPIQFNVAGFSGMISKSITVTCNDPTQPTVLLTLKGTIWKPIEVTPSYAYFFVNENSVSNETRSIRIISNLDEELKITEVLCTNAAFRTELKTHKPGKDYELVIGLVPPLPSTTVQSPITIKTSSTNMPVISVNVFATVQPTVAVSPQTLYLNPGPLPSNNVFTLTIRNTGTTNITVTEPHIDVEGATISLQEIQPGRWFTLRVSFPPGFKLEPGRSATITAKTSHPQYPLLKVPVFQFPSPSTAPVPPPRVVSTGNVPVRASLTPAPNPSQPGLQPVPVRPPPVPR